jgi:L-fuconolactonase
MFGMNSGTDQSATQTGTGLAKEHGSPAQMQVRPDWLATTPESPLDARRPIVDAHHHIWDPPGARYLVDEYLADLRSGHHVVASVFVECHGMWRAHGPEELRPVGETEFIAGVAAQSDSGRYGDARICSAIVGYADLLLGAQIDPVLDAHVQAADGRFRGIRGRVSSHSDPDINKWGTPAGVLRTEAARLAAAAIARRGLSLDAWVYQTQLDDILDLAMALPDLNVVIDHTGGPLGCGPYRGKRTEMFAGWAEGIRALARQPNTYMKLGGLGMRFSGFEFHLAPNAPTSDELVEAWRPYIETCIDAFGPSRCMFESNAPADKGTSSFAVLWNAFKKLAADLSEPDKDALFSGTARRVYRLSD